MYLTCGIKAVEAFRSCCDYAEWWTVARVRSFCLIDLLSKLLFSASILHLLVELAALRQCIGEDAALSV